MDPQLALATVATELQQRAPGLRVEDFSEGPIPVLEVRTPLIPEGVARVHVAYRPDGYVMMAIEPVGGGATGATAHRRTADAGAIAEAIADWATRPLRVQLPHPAGADELRKWVGNRVKSALADAAAPPPLRSDGELSEAGEVEPAFAAFGVRIGAELHHVLAGEPLGPFGSDLAGKWGTVAAEELAAAAPWRLAALAGKTWTRMFGLGGINAQVKPVVALACATAPRHLTWRAWAATGGSLGKIGSGRSTSRHSAWESRFLPRFKASREPQKSRGGTPLRRRAFSGGSGGRRRWPGSSP
jgi:hypothetical protein